MGKLSILLKETLIFRIIIAIAFIVISLLPLFSDFLKILMLSFSILIAGVNSISEIVVSFKNRDFQSYESLVIYFCVIVLLIIGYAIEGAIVTVIYEIGKYSIYHLQDIVKTKAVNLIDNNSLDLKSYIYEIFDLEGSDVFLMENQMKRTVNPILIMAMVLAIVYAVIMPVIHNLSYIAAIHRAIAIIIIATPISLISSFRSIASYELCDAAANGIIFNSASALEVVTDSKYLILDDDIIKPQNSSRIIYSHSSSMDNNTLLNFIYHVVYMSNQDFSQTIISNLKLGYQAGIVFDTTDIPGYGIKATINNMMVLFGNKELCNRFGIDVSTEENPDIRGEEYFLCISNKCVGIIILSDNSVADFDEIYDIFINYDIKTSLFSEKDNLRTTKKPIFSIFYPENASSCKKDINLSISDDPFSNNGCIIPDYIENISMIPYISRKVTQLCYRNCAIAYGIKIILIILSITGFCVPWFTIAVDTITAIVLIASILFSPNLNVFGSINGLRNLTKRNDSI